MEKVQIGKRQFFILFVMSVIAGDKISGLFGAELKQDKIIGLLIALLLSLLLFIMYYFIFANAGFRSVTETFDLLLGKMISKAFLLLFALYFIFITALDTRDIIQFVHEYLLETTPASYLKFLLIFTIYFSLINGIEVLARTAMILFNFVFFIFVTFSIIAVSVNDTNLYNFLPLIEDGIKPIIEPSLLMAVTIPMGEFFIIMFTFQHLKDRKKILLTGILAQLLAGFMILTVFFLNVLILSPETLKYMLSPALRISRRIEVEGFFQRFDLITLLVLLILSYVKSALLLYGSKQCIAHVFNIQSKKVIYGVLSVIVLILSIYYMPDYLLLLKASRKIVMPYINTSFEFGIPFILFILSLIKRKKIKKMDEDAKKKEEEKNKKDKVDELKETIKLKIKSLFKK